MTDHQSPSASEVPASPEAPPFPASGPIAQSRRTPIVGVGASAGGLEALEQFFSSVPAQSGIGYVVVQHLDPDKESLLVELLQRVCAIPVVQVRDMTRVEADHVYVAPPGYEVTVLHGVLHLLRPLAARGMRLPIDFFLRSLAVDQQSNAAGVVLSGMGSDGTLGLRALKEKAGGVFVQQPDTAKFQSMPRSAVDAELADVVAPPEELAEKLVAYFAHPLVSGAVSPHDLQKLHSALEKVVILVRSQTGHDFSFYKKSTVYRRIQRRMAIHQLSTVEEYVNYLRANAMEAELLYKELLIGVTCFFRDPDVWQYLKTEVIPRQLEAFPEGGTLRAWVAACSTGEEAYTLAMIFMEALQEIRPTAHYTLQIFATDLDQDAVERARTGLYGENIASDVSERRLERFFVKVPSGYRVSKDIRSMVIFAQQSIASDPPFARLNFLTCRNLLIYLEGELQQRLIQMFHGSLRPGGVLVLGSAETVGQASDMFAVMGAKTRIYRRLGAESRVGPPGLASYVPGAHLMSSNYSAPVTLSTPGAPSLQVLADQVLLRHFSPSAVLVTSQGDIVYFSGKTSKYLEPPAGKANLNLFAMARAGLAQPLSELFYRAVRQRSTAVLDEVTLSSGPESAPHTFSVTVEPLDEPKALSGMLMVVFNDLPGRPVPTTGSAAQSEQSERVAQLIHELAQAREEHQSTREEMQTSQEELRSANEELQSANEELTTSREEMQSMNEELQTVNSELQARVEALARASDDMENLLNSTDIATLFLDQFLNVRRFTTRATAVIKLIASDVGRPMTDIVTDLQYAGLADDAREVLNSLIFREKEIQASGDRWFKVRTMPYRTQDNRIDGVVITFSDISQAKHLEASLRSTQTGAAQRPRATPG
ncbi:MAG: chemotaxis protein CheB [Pseudomonadota bacterium]